MKKYLGSIVLLISLAVALFWVTRHQESSTPHSDAKRKEYKSYPKKVLDSPSEDVPEYVLVVLNYVREHGEAMDGFVGGRTFQNRERRLPIFGDDHIKIRYREWDVHPKREHVNRGAERLITGSDSKAYYTKDHYKTFQLIKE